MGSWRKKREEILVEITNQNHDEKNYNPAGFSTLIESVPDAPASWTAGRLFKSEFNPTSNQGKSGKQPHMLEMVARGALCPWHRTDVNPVLVFSCPKCEPGSHSHTLKYFLSSFEAFWAWKEWLKFLKMLALMSILVRFCDLKLDIQLLELTRKIMKQYISYSYRIK